MSASDHSGSGAHRSRKVFVVSGPSGAGKGTLIRGVVKYFPAVDVAISATTRAARPGEQHARDYYFVSQDDFDRYIAEDAFLEHVDFTGNRYGTLWSEIERLHADGLHVILELELQGALSVRESGMDAVLLFIEPPDFAELERRLRGRASDSDDEIQQRLEVAKSQVDAKEHFDYVIVNDDQDRSVAELQAIIERELLPVTGAGTSRSREN